MPYEGFARLRNFTRATGSGCTITVEHDATGQIDVAAYQMFIFAACAAK
jgi:hypothetical protein